MPKTWRPVWKWTGDLQTIAHYCELTDLMVVKKFLGEELM